MINRLIATLLFIVLHVAYYLLFKSFLTGTKFVLAVYACTLVTFVIMDGFLLKFRRKKRGSKHEYVDKE